MPHIANGPAFHVDVVYIDAEAGQDAENAEVFPERLLCNELEDGGRTVATQNAAAAADGPFHPAERETQQQEAAEIGHHEGTAAVLGGQAGETQEVTETDGAAGYGQHHTEVCFPVVCLGCVAHGIRRREGGLSVPRRRSCGSGWRCGLRSRRRGAPEPPR